MVLDECARTTVESPFRRRVALVRTDIFGFEQTIGYRPKNTL